MLNENRFLGTFRGHNTRTKGNGSRRRGCIFIYSCSTRLISFEMNLKTTDFKRNPSGITRIYEYTPHPPINAQATALCSLDQFLNGLNL